MIPIIKASHQQLTLSIMHFSYFLYEIFRFVNLTGGKQPFEGLLKIWFFV